MVTKLRHCDKALRVRTILYLAQLVVAVSACGAPAHMGDDPDKHADESPISCPLDPEVCAGGLGCHDGMCGKCSSPEECRGYDGCRADGTCGACESQSECRTQEVCRHGFCMPQAIPIIELAVDPTSFANLVDDLGGAKTDERLPCMLTAEGQAFEGCELRLHGNSARRFPKKSFRIDLPDDSAYPGYTRKMVLKADWNDPSIMRSFLAYESIRRLTNVPAPRVRYIKLYVNGTFYGLFTEIERIGSRFFAVRQQDSTSSLYEAYGWASLIPLPDASAYMSAFLKHEGDETDYSDLIDLIENVLWQDFSDSPSRTRTTTRRTDKVIHTDAYLQYLAVLVAIQNLDDTLNNFHLSLQPLHGKTAWETLPWDMDISFGCQWDAGSEVAMCGCRTRSGSAAFYMDPICDNTTLTHEKWSLSGVLSESEPDPTYPHYVWFNMLTHLMLNSPEHKPSFERYVCSFLSSDYWQKGLPKLIDAVAETIEDAVVEDANDLSKTGEDFHKSVQGIKDFIRDRASYVRTQEGAIQCP